MKKLVLQIPYKYRTIKSKSEGLYKERGSKFIGIAQACYSEDEAKKLLDLWREEHQPASHLCYAYRIGSDMKIYRANDDGEPNNSAGAPILGQIQSLELTNIVIGVVRYYGGTKLGVGGLINAYRTAARLALDNGKIITKRLNSILKLDFPYEEMPMIMDAIKQMQIPIEEQIFENACQLQVAVELPEKENFIERMGTFETLTIKEITIR